MSHGTQGHTLRLQVSFRAGGEIPKKVLWWQDHREHITSDGQGKISLFQSFMKTHDSDVPPCSLTTDKVYSHPPSGSSTSFASFFDFLFLVLASGILSGEEKPGLFNEINETEKDLAVGLIVTSLA